MQVAMNLGLPGAASLPKRAIQVCHVKLATFTNLRSLFVFKKC